MVMRGRSTLAGGAVACLTALVIGAVINSPICPQPLFLPSSHFPPNDLLQRVEKLGEGRLMMPEAICVDPKEEEVMLYTATRDGWIKRMRLPDGGWEDLQLVGGHSLFGLTTSMHGGFIVCDAQQGLLKVGEEGVTILTSEVAGTKIRFHQSMRYNLNDVVEAWDGSIYFSDATTKFGFHNARLDFLEANPSGRLLKYDPRTNKTSILLAELSFANGVTMSADQHYVVVCETWKFRCLKHWVKGDKEGRTEVLIDNLPGAPDNINLAPDGSFWIALVQIRMKGFDWIHSSSLAKRLIVWFPGLSEMISAVRKRAMVIKVTPEGKIEMMLDDSNGSVMSFVTSAVEFDGNLYLGSLATNFVGKLPLSIMNV